MNTKALQAGDYRLNGNPTSSEETPISPQNMADPHVQSWGKPILGMSVEGTVRLKSVLEEDYTGSSRK